MPQNSWRSERVCDEVGIVGKGDAIDGAVDFEEGSEGVEGVCLDIEETVSSRGRSV